MRPGQWETITLSDNDMHAAAARAARDEYIQRFLSPLMTAPSRLLGVAELVATDLDKSGQSPLHGPVAVGHVSGARSMPIIGLPIGRCG